MMRKVLFLAGLGFAASADTGVCAMNGARAVDDLLDSSTYIWASIERCKKPAPSNQGNQLLCAMDVSAAIESVNAMINVILKAVEGCGQLGDGQNVKCGLAAGVLTKTFAGLAAASAGVSAKCPSMFNNGKALNFLTDGPSANQGNGAAASAAQTITFAQCFVDVPDVVKSLFKATNRLIHIRDSCDGGDARACSRNSLKIVAAFSALGSYLAGAVGDCTAQTAANAKLQGDTTCASAALELVRHLTRMGSAGMALQMECASGEARLYALEHGEDIDEKKGSNTLTFVLGAFLPIAAVFGFVGGSRVGKRQSSTELVQDTEF